MRFLLFFLLLLVSVPAFAGEYGFDKAAQRYGVSPIMLRAISQVESGHAVFAVNTNENGSQDRGHMQINSVWRKAPEIGESGWNALFDAEYNTMVGAWVFRQCVDRFGYNWNAVSCYNTGRSLDDLAAEVERLKGGNLQPGALKKLARAEKRLNNAREYVRRVFNAQKRITANGQIAAN